MDVNGVLLIMHLKNQDGWLIIVPNLYQIVTVHPLIDEVVTMYKEGEADFHQMVADMANISRKEAKTVNLGIMYGMGRKKLADTLAITEDEAIELLANIS